MSEISTALFIQAMHRGVHTTKRPTPHSHRSQKLSMSRPGRTGRFEVLEGGSRTALIWRSTRS
jgi:hypothetical protein